jgi:hypothetical protein
MLGNCAQSRTIFGHNFHPHQHCSEKNQNKNWGGQSLQSSRNNKTLMQQPERRNQNWQGQS